MRVGAQGSPARWRNFGGPAEFHPRREGALGEGAESMQIQRKLPGRLIS